MANNSLEYIGVAILGKTNSPLLLKTFEAASHTVFPRDPSAAQLSFERSVFGVIDLLEPKGGLISA
jgi:hypothetical protein